VSRPLSFVAAALAPLVVVAVDPRGWSPYGPVKWVVVSVVAAACVAGVLAGGRLRVARPVTFVAGAFVAWAAVCALLGEDPLYAWTGTPERHFGVLTWALCAGLLVVGQSLGEGAARRVAAGAALAAGLLGVVSLAELAGWQPADLDGGGAGVVGAFGSSALTGAAGVLVVPVALGIALDPGWALRARRLAAAAAAGGGLAVLATGARAAAVGAVAAGLVAVAARPGWRPSLRSRRTRARSLVGVAAAVLVLAVSGGGARLGRAFTDDDGGVRGRLDEWAVAVRVVAAHPLVGVGPEGYRIAFPEEVDAAYERAHGREVMPDRAHSFVLDVAAATGLPGLALFVAVVALAGARALRAVRRGPPWLAGVGLGLVAYGVQQLFLFPLAEVDPVAWLLAGVVVAGAPSAARAQRPLVLRVPRPVALVPAGLTVVALVAGLADVAADRRARTALTALDQGRAGAAVAAGEGAAGLRGDVLRYRLVAAEALEAQGTVVGLRAALGQVDEALEVSPGDPVVRARRAELLAALAARSGVADDVDAALRAWQDAVARDPHNAQHRLSFGVLLAGVGRAEEAEAQWRLAEDLAPSSPAPSLDLALLYLRGGRLDEARAALDRAANRAPGHPQVAAVAAAIEEARA